MRPDWGTKIATEITPQDIDRWLGRFKTPATANRYKNFISSCFRIAMENGKVATNPARLVRQRKENNSRIRFLSKAEYDAVAKDIENQNPAQLQAFIVSVHTAMRWSEQYGITWSQVDFKRQVISRVETKSKNRQVVYRDVPLQ
jgi:integrase